MKVLGIDFGTTNTAVAFFDDTDPQKRILSIPYNGAADLLMKKTVPSVVYFDELGNPKYCGEPALEMGKSKPHLLVDKIKRVIGKTYEQAKSDPLLDKIAYELIAGKLVSEKDKKEQHEALVRVGEIEKKEYLPEDIAAMIISEARKDAEIYLRAEKGYENLDYDWVVITFPANFNQTQRGKIKEAAIKAGFDEKKLKFVNEPTAAAFDAVYEGKLLDKQGNGLKKHEVLVLNIGSGTTDLALVELRLGNGPARTIRKADTAATGGDSALGGTDMDIAIVNWVIEQLKKDPNVNTDLFTKTGKQRLRFDAEDAKIAISEGRCTQTRVRIPGFEAMGPMLDSKKLNSIAKHVVAKCIVEYNHILSKTKFKDADYQEIILTGGPMDMPIVKNIITSEFIAPIYKCSACSKQLHGIRPTDEFIEQTTGLPIDRKKAAKTDAWLYTHELEDNKCDEKGCYEHLVFSDGTHFEVTFGSDEKAACIMADRVDLQSRNHTVAEGVDPMMCVARGAAISPQTEYVSVLPYAIRLTVKGQKTRQSMKEIIQLNTQLPARVYESWIIDPWESNLEIHVLQDREETQHDENTDEYFGAFTNWGDSHYTLTPSKEDKKVYVGIDIKTPEAEVIELYILDSESVLANWLMNSAKFEGTPLKFKQRQGEHPVNRDGDNDPELSRVWAAFMGALRTESIEAYRLLTDTNDLVRSAAALQQDGYKLSSEAMGLVEKAWPSFWTIYCYMDSEAKRIKELKLSDKELYDQAKIVVTGIVHAKEYNDLTRHMRENNWETTLANMAITGDAISLLVKRIIEVTSRTQKLGTDADKIILTLNSALSSDLQFFQGYGNCGEILLKSREGGRFIEAKNRVAALETNLNAL